MLNRLIRNRRGIGTLETALFLPVVIALFFGGFELWQMLAASLRLDRATSQVSAAVARAPIGITEGEVTSILKSAGRAAEPSPLLTSGRLIVSAVEGGPAGTVLWQRCLGSLSTATSRIGTVGNLANYTAAKLGAPTKDTVVIVAETQFNYPIRFIHNLFPPIVLRHASMSIGRDAIGNAVVNAGTASPC